MLNQGIHGSKLLLNEQIKAWGASEGHFKTFIKANRFSFYCGEYKFKSNISAFR